MSTFGIDLCDSSKYKHVGRNSRLVASFFLPPFLPPPTVTPTLMTVTTIDEETPLLPEQQKKKPTPLPWAQFSILLVLQLAEPLTNQVIYPFLPQVSTSAAESVSWKAN